MKFPRTWLLLLAPIAFLVLSFVMMEVRGPYDHGPNIDPEYVALYNSLNLATLQPSHYYQHPATTLQIISAAVMIAKWSLGGFRGGWHSLSETVIEHDLEYLRAINITLVVLLSGISFWAGLSIYRQTGSVLPALAAQLTPLLYQVTVESLPRVAPELPVIIVGFALVIPLAPIVFGPDPESSSRDSKLALVTGALVSVGIATKANFAVFGLLLFLFPGIRQKMRFVISCLATLAVLLLPIAAQAHQAWNWFIRMAARSGRYGEGDVGLPAVEAMLNNLSTIYNDEPFFFAFCGFYVIILLASWRGARSGVRVCSAARKALLLGILIMSLQVALILKHYSYHYILPAEVLMVMLNACAVVILRTVPVNLTFRVAVIIVGLLCCYGGFKFNYRRMTGYASWKRDTFQSFAEMAAAREGLGRCLVIGYYRSSAPTYAHFFGNSLAAGYHWEALEAVHPGDVHYDRSQGKLYFWSFSPARQEVERRVVAGDCVLVQGQTTYRHEFIGFQLEPIYLQKDLWEAEGLWRLHLDAANPELIDNPDPPSYAIVLPAVEFGVTGTAHSAVEAPDARRYVIRIRYASDSEQPLRIFLNGQLISDLACVKPTGGLGPENMKWHEIGTFAFLTGQNVLRLEADGAPPEIDQIAVIPILQDEPTA